MGKIRVHEKALAHLSRGLYRSPASALRELVSNAWDANATEVRIDTGAPFFTQLSVTDNGDGFSEQEFERLMTGGIGNSDKRSSRQSLIHNRPVIGRLGIGLLGIAQICGAFDVISKPKTGKAFRARVRLYDLIRPRLDADDAQIVHTADELGTAVDVGEYDFVRDFDPSEYSEGTTVVTNDVHPAFYIAFKSTCTELPRSWKNFVIKSARKQTLQELGDYWRLMWELAALCPVSYIGYNAVPDGLIRADNRRLREYNFHLFVDGHELFKPVLLQGNKWGYTGEQIKRREQRVFGKPLHYHGYLVVQEGKQLTPDELRGILVRIKDVGVGLYDASLLDYRYNEGPRSRWITGEIYVDEGLEDAVNVDRDSFNRFHPEFRALQQRVHNILQKNVFARVYKNIDERSAKREQERTASRTATLKSVIEHATDRKVSVRVARVQPKPDEPAVKDIRDRLEIDLTDPGKLPVKKRSQSLASALIAIFDISMRERTTVGKRRKFIEQLSELLSRW